VCKGTLESFENFCVVFVSDVGDMQADSWDKWRFMSVNF
jgi:hypothetical protein